MKQPGNELLHSEDVGMECWHYIDMSSTEVGYNWAEIAVATTEQAAWRKAVRRLERLLGEAKKKAGME